MHVLVPDGSPIVLWGLIDGEELNLTAFLVDHIQPGDVAIDVGAHFGYYSLLLAALVGPQGMVHAFEPTPRSFKILESNVIGRPNVVVQQKALWKSSGTVDLLDFGMAAGSLSTLLPPDQYPHGEILHRHRKSAARIPAEAVTLDEYIHRLGVAPTFVKLDAEGSEYEILLGAGALLKRRPLLAVETWHEAWERGQARRVIDLLCSYGYVPYSLHRGRPVELDHRRGRDYTNLVFMAHDVDGYDATVA